MAMKSWISIVLDLILGFLIYGEMLPMVKIKAG